MFKKTLALLCLTLSIVLFCIAVFATETETESESTETVDIDAIYVSEDGTEDISAPVVATLTEAYRLIGNEGTIYLMDTVEVSATEGDCFIAPAHTGKITITSADGYDGALDLTAIKHIHFGGETEWNNIGVIANDVVLTADNNTVTMGEGLEVSSHSDDTYYRSGHIYCGARIHLAAYAPCETANVTCDTAAGKLYVHSGEYWSVSSWYGGAVTVSGGKTQIYLGKRNETESIWVRYLCPGLFGVTMDEPLTSDGAAVVVAVDTGLNTAEPYRFTQNNFSGKMTVNWLLRDNMQGSANALVAKDFYPASDANCYLYVSAERENAAAQNSVYFFRRGIFTKYLGKSDGTAELFTSGHTHDLYTKYDGRILCSTCEYEECRHLTSVTNITPATCSDYEKRETYCTDICKKRLKTERGNALDPNYHGEHTLYYRYSSKYDYMAYRCEGCDKRFKIVYREEVPNTVIIGSEGTDYTPHDLPPTDGSPYYFATYSEALEYINIICNFHDSITIEIRGDVVIPYAIDLPEFGGHVHMTGSENARLIFDCQTKRIRVNDDMTIDNIKFAGPNNAVSGIVVCAQNHKLVMGEGITTQSVKETFRGGSMPIELGDTDLYVIGGFPGPNGTEKPIDADITIRSGDYRFIGGWCFNSKTDNGKAKMTLGKTNPDDVLSVEYLTPFSRGDGYITEQAETTIIIDGVIDVTRFYVTTMNLATEGIPYVTNVVLKGNITGTFDILSTNDNDFYPRTVVNVYTDSRVGAAVNDLAKFVGSSKDTTLNTIRATVNSYSYEDYCANFLDGHSDTDADSLCDECGHNMSETE